MSDMAHQLIPLILEFSSCKPRQSLYNTRLQLIVQSNLDHFQAVYTLAALATLAFTDNTQYLSTGNIEVLSWFLESVPPRLLAVNVSTYGTKTLSSMVQ